MAKKSVYEIPLEDESREVTGLVSKPQFDDKIFKVGKAVHLAKTNTAFNYSSNNIGKFSSGDYGLIQGVSPLSISILLVDNKVATIPVEAVADRSVIITIW